MSNAFTANLSPSFFDINLRGRNTLRSRNALNDLVELESMAMETTEKTTIMKSTTSQIFRK